MSCLKQHASSTLLAVVVTSRISLAGVLFRPHCLQLLQLNPQIRRAQISSQLHVNRPPSARLTSDVATDDPTTTASLAVTLRGISVSFLFACMPRFLIHPQGQGKAGLPEGEALCLCRFENGF